MPSEVNLSRVGFDLGEIKQEKKKIVFPTTSKRYLSNPWKVFGQKPANYKHYINWISIIHQALAGPALR